MKHSMNHDQLHGLTYLAPTSPILVHLGADATQKLGGTGKARRASSAATFNIPQRVPQPPELSQQAHARPASASQALAGPSDMDIDPVFAPPIPAPMQPSMASRTSNGGSSQTTVRASAPQQPEAPPKPPAVVKSVLTTLAVPRAWNEKVRVLSLGIFLSYESGVSLNCMWSILQVEALQSLTEALRQLAASDHTAGYDPTKDLEKMAPKLIECLEDGHQKVQYKSNDPERRFT